MRAPEAAAAPARPHLLLIPFFAALGLFWLVPLGKGFLLSLQSDTLYGSVEFVGLDHYRRLLADGRFRHALLNTLLQGTFTLLGVIPLALLAAHLLRQVSRRLRSALAFCLILPGLTPPTVLAFLFLLVFSGPQGMLNSLIGWFGVQPLDWIRDPGLIKISLVLQGMWRWTGFAAFFFLAALEGIPQGYLQVARLEGAGPWQLFWRVTLPLLRPILLFVSLFLLLDALVLFEGAYVLLGSSGGTADAGLLLVTYAYYAAFTLGKFGYAAAMSFTLVPLAALTLFLLYRSARSSRLGDAVP